MAFLGLVMAGLSLREAIRDKVATAARLTPNVCVLIGLALVGALLGEVVVASAKARSSVVELAIPIAVAFLLPLLLRFGHIHRPLLVQLSIFACFSYILVCCTPLSQYVPYVACNLLLAANGALFVSAGWLSHRGARLLGVCILVLFVGGRYLGFRYWQDAKTSYQESL
jgi:hypothetical protein